MTPADSQVRLMTKVAHLYHEQGLRQADIADQLHLSQARVSRLLKRALNAGIVRTVVVVSSGVHTAIEAELEQRYGLAEAVVADVDGDEAHILPALGSVGAAHLESTLTGGERIGISSWSQSLLAIVDRLGTLRTADADSVVQLVGGAGVPMVQAQANRLLGSLAQVLGAEPTYVQAPGLVASSDVRAGLLSDPAMEGVAEAWGSLTTAIVGIGSLEPSPLLQLSGNALPEADQRRLLAAGAVGDVCHRFFDDRGTPIVDQLVDRVVGIDTPTFMAIPRRIGIAGGERKHAAIRAAMLGGWVNVLITDLGSATFLLAD